MKIGTQDPSGTPPPATRRSLDSKKADRFAKVMKGGKAGKGGVAEGTPQEEKSKPAADALGRPLFIQPAAYLSQGGLGVDGLGSERAGAALPPELEALSSELGARLELVQQAGTARELNITFESQAFAGLRVQLQQAAGEVNIQFVTNSPAITRLLRQHVGALRDTLAQKGVKVRTLGVGGLARQQGSGRYGNA